MDRYLFVYTVVILKIKFKGNNRLSYTLFSGCSFTNGDGFDKKKLNPDLLKNFIKNRMNESLVNIGYSKIFNVDKDLVSETDWFDEQLYGNNMTDFFHSRPTEYAKSNKSFGEEDLF